jgi:gas vesicle protein
MATRLSGRAATCEDEMEDTNDIGGRLAWFITGAAIGVAVGILFAPAEGKRTRAMLNERTHEGAGAVADTGRDVFDRGREMYERGRELIEDAAILFDRGRKLVQGS